ncbi:cytochrome c3 family protein [Acidobacteriota bacterium]
MKKTNLIVLVLPLLFLLPSFLKAQTNSCIECHKELEDELIVPVEDFKNDIHQKFGLGCSDCHGGNPEQEDLDLAKDKSFLGVPGRNQIPELCGACHSDSSYMRNFNPGLRVDQLFLYRTSQHGQLLKKGDEKVAVCTDCHNAHNILASTHPQSRTFPWNIPDTCGRCHSDQDYMKSYNIPTDQAVEYKASAHSFALFEKKDLSAPVCNDCHGNHGAAPPEVDSIAFVCRQCHPSAGDLFSNSPHKEAFDELGFSECEACHGNHKILTPTDEMLGIGEKAVCIQCHDPDSVPYQIASRIKNRFDGFLEKIHAADRLLERAERQGVEVSEPKFKLTDVNTTLIFARNLIHSFSLADIEEKIEEGEIAVEEVLNAGEEALKEAKFRKTGLVIATLFIFLLAISLFLKIRHIEKKSRS